MERENNKGAIGGAIFLAVLFALIALGLGGYIIYDKLITTTSDNDTVETSKSDVLNQKEQNASANTDLQQMFINEYFDNESYKVFQEGMNSSVMSYKGNVYYLYAPNGRIEGCQREVIINNSSITGSSFTCKDVPSTEEYDAVEVFKMDFKDDELISATEFGTAGATDARTTTFMVLKSGKIVYYTNFENSNFKQIDSTANNNIKTVDKFGCREGHELTCKGKYISVTLQNSTTKEIDLEE